MEIKEKIDKLFLTLVEEKLILDDPKEKNVFTRTCEILINNFFMENDEEDIGTPVITPTILPYEECVLRFDGEKIRYYYKYKAV